MKTMIELAREAGIRDCTCDGTLGCLERFANLVRADERARMAEQPAQQEPVAWLYPEGLKALQDGKCWTAYPTKHEDCIIPLYTTPQAQRTWVGLTDEELKPLCAENHIVFGAYTVDFIRAIEAKLRSKNEDRN